MVHEITIKQSLKRYGMWQIKGENHDIHPLEDMKLLILKLVTFLGCTPEDNITRFLLRYSGEPFDGWMVALDRVRTGGNTPVHGCEYRVVETSGPEYFMSDPVFPPALLVQIGSWPERLYLSLQITGRRILLPKTRL